MKYSLGAHSPDAEPPGCRDHKRGQQGAADGCTGDAGGAALGLLDLRHGRADCGQRLPCLLSAQAVAKLGRCQWSLD